ncbi:MAG: hypothetical protein JW816_00240 [Candidatus Buchananbacteria bacterium]|nr:hypothetical protein [Candidatus Buchananbacteria bacterium]
MANQLNKKALIKTKTKQKPSWQKLMVLTLVFFVFTAPLTTLARNFNPNDIISDQDLFNQTSLSKTAIQVFLNRENSVLANYTQTIAGQKMTAAEMIWQVAQQHGVNPKFILTTLEKEQSLISKDQATQKVLDWATGYGCYNNRCIEKYRGFYNQIDAAAETQELYRQKANTFSFIVGQTTTTSDGFKITPANQATANLYIYTPYVGNAPEYGISSRFGANKLFWRIWNRYFTSQKFLDGQIITNGNNYWLIKDNQKCLYANQQTFLADHSINQAILAKADDINAYSNGPTIYFTNNTLVKSSLSGQIFLIDGLTKRAVIDQSALALLTDFTFATLDQTQIKSVPETQLTVYDSGAFIYATSLYPQGKFFKDESGAIWQIKDSVKHQVDLVVYQNEFANQVLEPTTVETMKQYPTGEPLKLSDGTFVINDGKYYLISNGERMRIQNEDLFNQLFGLDKKQTAVDVSDDLLNLYQAGEIIDYIDDTIKDPVTPDEAINENLAEFISINPKNLSLLAGTKTKITITFKNNSAQTWQSGEVWLTANDQNQTTNSFGIADKINFNESSVESNATSTFSLTLNTPADQTGMLYEDFSLYQTQNGIDKKIAITTNLITIKPNQAAEIIEDNIPVAVKNNWRPIQITMRIKNISPDTTWLSRKTALEIYNDDNKPSVFYDKNDWVRKEVAAVPINKTTIKPGETGEFKFTLDPRGLKKGTYTLRFNLKLLDKDKQVYLNDNLNFDRLIRVD